LTAPAVTSTTGLATVDRVAGRFHRIVKCGESLAGRIFPCGKRLSPHGTQRRLLGKRELPVASETGGKAANEPAVSLPRLLDCAGALVRWCAGALVRWCAGALVRWCAGALVRWCAKNQFHAGD